MTRTRKFLIPREELDGWTRKLTNPREVCRTCGGKVDCIGSDECFPVEAFHVIEIDITPLTKTDLMEMLLK